MFGRKSQYAELRDSGAVPTAYLESWRAKCIPIVALAIPTTVSITLVYLNVIGWRSTGRLLSILIEKPEWASGVIQTTAEVLASLQLFALLCLVNFATRVELCRSKTTLDTLKYRAAICLGRFDLSLPPMALIIVLSIYLISKAPAFLWATSLTLVPTLTNSTQTLTLPIFGADNFEHNDWRDELSRCWQLNANAIPSLGGYSSCPAKMYLSGLLQDASSASSDLGSWRLDGVPFYYLGRSFGLGSVVGLSDTVANGSDLFYSAKSSAYDSNLMGYSYNETGFNTTVQCAPNPSTWPLNWRLHRVENGSDSLNIPYVFEAYGHLEDNSSTIYYVWGLNNDSKIAAWATTNLTQNANSLSIAAGSDYLQLNNTVCSISFTPSAFTVNVDMGAGSIEVVPSTFMPDMDLDETWHLRTLVLEQLEAISMIGTTLYRSILGDALLTNLAISAAQESDDTGSLAGLEDSIEAIIDDLFVLLTAAQVSRQIESLTNATDWIWPQDQFQNVSVTATWVAAQVGSTTYVIGLFVFNIFCIVVLIIEMIRWRFWKDLPALNFTDLKSAILGAAVGGNGISAALEETNQRGTQWTGRSKDKEAGQIEIHVSTNAMLGTKKSVSFDAEFDSARPTKIGFLPWLPFRRHLNRDSTNGTELDPLHKKQDDK